MKHLLSALHLSPRDIADILHLATDLLPKHTVQGSAHTVQGNAYARKNSHTQPKINGSRGDTNLTQQQYRDRCAVNLFLENSTRTKTSFLLALEHLGFGVVDFAVGDSSIKKGESLRDTVETLLSMGVELFVVRCTLWSQMLHIAQVCDGRACVINAGAGAAQHPTQGLVDILCILEYVAGRKGVDVREMISAIAQGVLVLEGVRVLFVGDILHSRVARSTAQLVAKLGGSVGLCGPSSLAFDALGRAILYSVGKNTPQGGFCGTFQTLEQALLQDFDVCILLRPQVERAGRGYVGGACSRAPLGEYASRWKLTSCLLRGKKPVLIMHPGPVAGCEASADLLFAGKTVAGECLTEEGHFVAISRQVEVQKAVRAACIVWGVGSAAYNTCKMGEF